MQDILNAISVMNNSKAKKAAREAARTFLENSAKGTRVDRAVAAIVALGNITDTVAKIMRSQFAGQTQSAFAAELIVALENRDEATIAGLWKIAGAQSLWTERDIAKCALAVAYRAIVEKSFSSTCSATECFVEALAARKGEGKGGQKKALAALRASSLC